MDAIQTMQDSLTLQLADIEKTLLDQQVEDVALESLEKLANELSKMFSQLEHKFGDVFFELADGCSVYDLLHLEVDNFEKAIQEYHKLAKEEQGVYLECFIQKFKETYCKKIKHGMMKSIRQEQLPIKDIILEYIPGKLNLIEIKLYDHQKTKRRKSVDALLQDMSISFTEWLVWQGEEIQHLFQQNASQSRDNTLVFLQKNQKKSQELEKEIQNSIAKNFSTTNVVHVSRMLSGVYLREKLVARSLLSMLEDTRKDILHHISPSSLEDKRFFMEKQLEDLLKEPTGKKQTKPKKTTKTKKLEPCEETQTAELLPAVVLPKKVVAKRSQSHRFFDQVDKRVLRWHESGLTVEKVQTQFCDMHLYQGRPEKDVEDLIYLHQVFPAVDLLKVKEYQNQFFFEVSKTKELEQYGFLGAVKNPLGVTDYGIIYINIKLYDSEKKVLNHAMLEPFDRFHGKKSVKYRDIQEKQKELLEREHLQDVSDDLESWTAVYKANFQGKIWQEELFSKCSQKIKQINFHLGNGTIIKVFSLKESISEQTLD